MLLILQKGTSAAGKKVAIPFLKICCPIGIEMRKWVKLSVVNSKSDNVIAEPLIQSVSSPVVQ